MLIGLQCGVALRGVLHQQFGDQVFGFVAAFVERLTIESVYPFFDAHEDCGYILAVKGRSST
jgi:hypothetical protein